MQLAASADTDAIDALTKMKERATAALFERVGAKLNDPTMSEDKLHALVRAELNTVVEEDQVPLTTEQRQRLISDVQDDVLGHGPLQRLLDDVTVTEIMVNGPDQIFIEQNGRLTRSSRPLRVRGAVAPRDRAHRLPGRAPDRRVVAAGGRPPARRLARQRGDRADRLQRLVADHP